MLKKIILLISVLLTAVLFFSCSDRGVTTVDESFDRGLIFTSQHLFSYYLEQSMFSNIAQVPLVRFLVYHPYEPDNNQVPGPPYPVLYLLSPYGEDEYYYFNNGLKDLADRMISSKEIKPMIIVCVNGSNGFGGSFYGSTFAGGKYCDLMGNKLPNAPLSDSRFTLLNYVDGFFNTLYDRSQRGISGVGMGGYGALRIATVYSPNFGSVSAISGPLDFDGTGGNGGFVPLFQQVIDELDTNYYDMDTSSTAPLRNMLFAAAASFSPHDTGVTGDANVITDMETYFAPLGETQTLRFHLPFDSTGDPYPPIWNMWLDNNLENILGDYPDALDTTEIYIMTSPEGEYNFYDQTADFHDHLTSLNIEHTYEVYTGYPGYPAADKRFTYDALKKILKFHSDHFVIP